jgi:hypothetical protein
LLQQLSEKLKEAQAVLLLGEAGINDKTGDRGGVQAKRETAQELLCQADEIIAKLPSEEWPCSFKCWSRFAPKHSANNN